MSRKTSRNKFVDASSFRDIDHTRLQRGETINYRSVRFKRQQVGSFNWPAQIGDRTFDLAASRVLSNVDVLDRKLSMCGK